MVCRVSETKPSIVVEDLSPELFAEVMPLAQKCWDESTTLKGENCAFYGEREFKIEPFYEMYEQLAKSGLLVVVTLRDEGVLVGYVIGFSYRTLHHKHIVAGIGDSIYIEPDFRAYTPFVAKVFENEMAKRGAQIIGWPTQENGPVYEFLKSMGYVGDDIVMEKRLCV